MHIQIRLTKFQAHKKQEKYVLLAKAKLSGTDVSSIRFISCSNLLLKYNEILENKIKISVLSVAFKSQFSQWMYGIASRGVGAH